MEAGCEEGVSSSPLEVVGSGEIFLELLSKNCSFFAFLVRRTTL